MQPEFPTDFSFIKVRMFQRYDVMPKDKVTNNPIPRFSYYSLTIYVLCLIIAFPYVTDVMTLSLLSITADATTTIIVVVLLLLPVAHRSRNTWNGGGGGGGGGGGYIHKFCLRERERERFLINCLWVWKHQFVVTTY